MTTTKIRAKIWDLIKSLLFSGPSFVGMLLFYIIPFGVVVYYSLITGPIDPQFAGLDNFRKVIGNAAFQTAVKNTAMFSAIAVPGAVILSMALAVMLEARIPLKSQFRTFFLSPMMVPIASIILVWQVLFHDNGVVNALLQNLGKDKIYWFSSEYSMVVIVLLFWWKNLGYNMILFMASLNNIPKAMLEAAEVEGAGPWYTFWHIKLRFLSPTVLFVTILSIINSFKVFREIYLLTGDYPYDTLYMLQHYMNNMFGRKMDYQRLSAAAVMLAIVIIILIAILFAVEGRYGKDVEG